MSNEYPHRPVLLEECLALLGRGAERGATVVDGTVGTGGHAEAILVRNAPDGRLIGLDRDAEALRIAAGRLAPFGDRVVLVQASFRELDRVLAEHGIARVD